MLGNDSLIIGKTLVVIVKKNCEITSKNGDPSPSPFYEVPIYFFCPFFERKKKMILKGVLGKPSNTNSVFFNIVQTAFEPPPLVLNMYVAFF